MAALEESRQRWDSWSSVQACAQQRPEQSQRHSEVSVQSKPALKQDKRHTEASQGGLVAADRAVLVGGTVGAAVRHLRPALPRPQRRAAHRRRPRHRAEILIDPPHVHRTIVVVADVHRSRRGVECDVGGVPVRE